MDQSSTQTSSLLLAAIHSPPPLSPKEPLFSSTSSTPHRLELMRVLTRQCTHSLSSDPSGKEAKGRSAHLVSSFLSLSFPALPFSKAGGLEEVQRCLGTGEGGERQRQMRQYSLVSLQLDHISSPVLLSAIVQHNQMTLWSGSFGVYLVHLCLDWLAGSRTPGLSLKNMVCVYILILTGGGDLNCFQYASAAHLLL